MESRPQKTLRILTLCYEYPPVGGGGGRVAAQVARSLVERGHEVRIQTAGMKGLARRETIDGVEIFRTQSFRKKRDTCTVPEMALYVLTSFFPTLLHLCHWKPHVIHVHFAVPTGALAWAATRIFRVPYLLTAHLGDVPGGVPEQTSALFARVMPLTRPIWKDAAETTAVSSFVKRLAENAYGRSPMVIFNGIEAGPRPDIRPHNPARIVFAGRMSIQKNPLLAIEALRHLSVQPWKADFVGDGPLLEESKALVKRYGIEDRITFHGWTDGPKVKAILKEADILLMTSLSEGLPMIGVEALSEGLAIVGVEIDGLLDVVDNGSNGFLVASESGAQGLADALRKLIENSYLLKTMRDRSADKVVEFDLKRVVDSYESALINIS